MTFRIQYHTEWGECIALVEDSAAYPMTWTEGDVWTVSIDPPKGPYGYRVLRDGIVQRVEWEDHVLPEVQADTVTDFWIDCPVPGCRFERKHSAAIFDRPGFRGAGTVVPVFSLRSGRDCGIGEFLDLKPLVDWAAATGQCIIQLLPVNDTTRRGGWEDSYPYSPVSAFALNPMYIDLEDAGAEVDERVRIELNGLPEIDYPRVYEVKMEALSRRFAQLRRQPEGVSAFARDNALWLDEYASFAAGRDALAGHPERNEAFHRWLQYELDRQFMEAVSYARARGVFFKGDLPIGVSADSADAHCHPELFNLDSTAGAPPDYFSQDGQNWGFPTYNWESMALDGYDWWKRRLGHMARYFDAFRIDHVLGFFRIWEIPSGCASGKDGHFNPALPYTREEIESAGLPTDERLFSPDSRNSGLWQPRISPDTSALEPWQKERFDVLYVDFFHHRHNDFWRRNAERKLPELLYATGMLACAEDLGMIPDCVPEVMGKYRLLSLEMAEMDKGHPWPELAVAATSSHDMETLRMQYVRKTGKSDMPATEARRQIWHHLDSAPMLAILPVQDWLSMSETLRRRNPSEERINEPSDPHHHWRYRLHLNADEILAGDRELNICIESMLRDSRRYL